MRAVALSIVSVVELHGGIVRLPVGQDQRASALAELLDTPEVWEFGLAEAKACGRIILAVGISRTKVLDRMVAAQAAVADATLATLKARDFRNIPNLRVEDWS
jgi:tRNA(fMet)-specific endonuclease VapC